MLNSAWNNEPAKEPIKEKVLLLNIAQRMSLCQGCGHSGKGSCHRYPVKSLGLYRSGYMRRSFLSCPPSMIKAILFPT